jgi:hypothetical protein
MIAATHHGLERPGASIGGSGKMFGGATMLERLFQIADPK